MATRVVLEDPADPRLADFAGVREPARLRTQGQVLLEGRQLVVQALSTQALQVESLLLTPAAEEALQERLGDGLADVPRYVMAGRSLLEATGYRFHQGCLALARRPAALTLEAWRSRLPAAPERVAVLALERVTSPDNLGALLRTAAGFGVAGVVLSPGCADPWYRKCVRTSMGAVLRVPHLVAEDWLGTLDALAQDGLLPVALDPYAGDALDDLMRTTEGARSLFVLGNEGEGLTAGTRNHVRHRVRIPIDPEIDSLNVAAAGAIALYAWATAQPDVPRV